MSLDLTRAIVTAADEGRLQDVAQALAAGASPDAMGPLSGALHCAVFNGHEAVVRLLLQHGANPDNPDTRQFYPLQLAASRGRNELCRILIEHGAGLECKTDKGGTALHVAAASDFPETVQLLIDAGADVHSTDTMGNTPLATACGLGRAKVIQLLCRNGSDLSVRNNDGETLLIKLARALYGMRLSQWSTSGMIGKTPTRYDINKGCFTITRGEETRVLDDDEQHDIMQLDWAPQEHMPYLEACDAYTQLLKAGADKDSADADGHTVMTLTCHTGEGRLIRQLIDAGVPRAVKAANGVTPLHMAAGSGRPDGLEELLKDMPGAELREMINAVDEYGWTPLHYLADIGGTETMARILLQHGADPAAESTAVRGGDMPAGMRPADVARHWNDEEMASFLQS